MPKNRVPNCVLNRMILKFNPDMVWWKLGVPSLFYRIWKSEQKKEICITDNVF